MSRPPLVRPVGEGDLDRLAELHWRGWEDAYRGLVADGLLDATTLELRRAQWRDWSRARRHEGFVRLAECEGAPAGFVAAAAARDIAALGAAGEIVLLYVDRAAQGRGLGRALMRAAAAWAGQAHPGPLGLWVVSANAPARAFYARMGGRAGPERREIVRGHPVVETAYLWDDAQALADQPSR